MKIEDLIRFIHIDPKLLLGPWDTLNISSNSCWVNEQVFVKWTPMEIGGERFWREMQIYAKTEHSSHTLKPLFNQKTPVGGILVLPKVHAQSFWNLYLEASPKEVLRAAQQAFESLAEFHFHFKIPTPIPYDIPFQLNPYKLISPLYSETAFGHGDCHFGNLLVKKDSMLWIDFEGGLLSKEWAVFDNADFWDVACLLKSLHYLSCISGHPDWENFPLAETFEHLIDVYLSVYPKQEMDRFRRDVKSALIFRSLYEVEYEKKHRPEMEWIPESFIKEFL